MDKEGSGSSGGPQNSHSFPFQIASLEGHSSPRPPAGVTGLHTCSLAEAGG